VRVLIMGRVTGLELSAGRLAGPHLDPTQPTAPRRSAVAAALALHALVLAALLVHWRPTPVEEPPPIPVALVFEKPPPPVPAPAPPPPAPLAMRRSGPDLRTRAPQAAEEVAPKAEAPPPPAEPRPVPLPATKPEAPPAATRPVAMAALQSPPAAAAAPPAAAIKAPPHRAVALRAPRREIVHARAPERHADEAAIGDKVENGDPYLNRLFVLINRNRPKSTPIGPSGLHLAGTTVFAATIDRSGTLRGLRLEQSSGAVLLDDTAREMILKAAPFPPLPPDLPPITHILITLDLFPQ
jgi:periplasmic protein TonB